MSKYQTQWEGYKDIPLFASANEFSMFIENSAAEQKLTHIEMLLSFCEDHLIESVDIAEMINTSLKDKLEQEFRDLNLLPKKAQLDYDFG